MSDRVARSPSLIPKPDDWAQHISVAGFYCLEGGPLQPSQALASFLETGPPPIYIGFGSIVVEDPKRLTDIIFRAVRQIGQRALLSIGWGGLGTDSFPENIFLLLRLNGGIVPQRDT